jgi:hypothetical protein
LNLFFRSAFAKLTFASTPGMTYEPWTLLKNHLDDVRVEEHFFGWMFLAWGQSTRPEKTITSPPPETRTTPDVSS